VTALSLDLALLAERIAKGRVKYPEGCTALSLFDEAGEVAHAINKREPIDRVRAELLDVAVVAMRLYFGEVDEDSVLKGLLQLGAKCLRCRAFVQHGHTLCSGCVDEMGP
jgi:hypothetical protein